MQFRPKRIRQLKWLVLRRKLVVVGHAQVILNPLRGVRGPLGRISCIRQRRGAGLAPRSLRRLSSEALRGLQPARMSFRIMACVRRHPADLSRRQTSELCSQTDGDDRLWTSSPTRRIPRDWQTERHAEQNTCSRSTSATRYSGALYPGALYPGALGGNLERAQVSTWTTWLNYLAPLPGWHVRVTSVHPLGP